MTTLVTGVNGFLGTALAADLVASEADVVGLDVAPGETETSWPVETLDVRDRDALRSLIGDRAVDSILHCGGVSGPRVANEDAALVTVATPNGTFRGTRSGPTPMATASRRQLISLDTEPAVHVLPAQPWARRGFSQPGVRQIDRQRLRGC